MKSRIQSFALLLLACIACPGTAHGRTIARLFWQDDASASVHCADLNKTADGWSLDDHTIEGMPAIDEAEQSLVQMQHHDGMLVIGVRDVDEGKIASGWFAIETGVIEEPHGDHSHWYFKEQPRVIRTMIDQSQGNPAHVYRYDNAFVLANDKLNGFTLTSPQQIRQAGSTDQASTFHPGGNGHITLAVAPNRVAYATWIAPAGEHSGRVDVIGLGENQGKSYSFTCPTGMLHGAALVSGKAFFAPADGVCWVAADENLEHDSESVSVHHLSLGHDKDDKPLRTGAFTPLDNHLIFTAGDKNASKLCWIDASCPQPSVSELSIAVRDGEKLTTPVAMKTRYGDSIAVLFGQNVESPEEDRMIFVQLDPDRDGDWGDTKIVKSLAIGRNQINGHAGYHSATMLPDRRHIAVTNPGDGTIWLIHSKSHEVVAKLTVDGTPTRLVAVP